MLLSANSNPDPIPTQESEIPNIKLKDLPSANTNPHPIPTQEIEISNIQSKDPTMDSQAERERCNERE